MKWPFQELFYVPKYGKVRESTMLSRMILSGIMIVACLVAMSLTAFAYFTCSVSSTSTVIKAASYSLDVVAPEGVTVNNGSCELTAGSADTDFVFTLKKAGSASVGYGKISASIYEPQRQMMYSKTLFTQPIGTYLVGDQTVTVDERTVTVTVPAGYTATVRFVGQWGSCSATREVGEQMDMTKLGLPTIVTEPDPTDPEPNDPEPTEPETTEPEPTEPEPTEPEPTEPEPTEPETTEPEVTEQDNA